MAINHAEIKAATEHGPPADPTQHFAVWPKRIPHTMVTPDTTLWANLDISMRRYPNRIAYVFFDRQITFRELHASVESLAGWLQQAAGVKRGDRVALCLQNSLQFVIGYYAILRADAVVVPVNPMNRNQPLLQTAVIGCHLYLYIARYYWNGRRQMSFGRRHISFCRCQISFCRRNVLSFDVKLVSVCVIFLSVDVKLVSFAVILLAVNVKLVSIDVTLLSVDVKQHSVTHI